MKRVYLDHNATTPVDPEVMEAMLPYLGSSFGNPSSLHVEGQQARAAVDHARAQVASLIGAEPQEIVFTSGGTEANHLALWGLMQAPQAQGKRLLTSLIEHHSVLCTAQALAKAGFQVSSLSVDHTGVIRFDELDELVTNETMLISVMLANNETGVIQPIQKIAKRAKGHGVLVHTDAIQAVGKIPVNVKELEVDVLSISAHKMYGPKGVGALYIRKGVQVKPQLEGGGQERNRRAGTENVAGIVGFGKACELARKRLALDRQTTQQLRDGLERRILESIDQVKVNGQGAPRVPNTSNVSFYGSDAESLIIGLDLTGIAVSNGAACISGTLEPSHVLEAMQVPPAWAKGTLRFSWGWANTPEELDHVVAALTAVVARIRASPLPALPPASS